MKILTEKMIFNLMNEYANILTQLRKLGITRTYNTPVGDYAEWLVAQKMHLILEHNSTKGFDAKDPKTNTRYQIKSRWEHPSSKTHSRQLNVIRNYTENQFDFLIVLIFGEQFNVKEAYCMPHKLIKQYGKYSNHQNGYILTVSKDWASSKNIQDITYLFNK